MSFPFLSAYQAGHFKFSDVLQTVEMFILYCTFKMGKFSVAVCVRVLVVKDILFYMCHQSTYENQTNMSFIHSPLCPPILIFLLLKKKKKKGIVLDQRSFLLSVLPTTKVEENCNCKIARVSN